MIRRPIFIIAEAGVNHNGDIRMAKDLVLAAKDAGADAVKFQSFRAERLASKKANLAPYQKVTVSTRSQRDMIAPLELDNSAHSALFSFCKRHGIEFLSTPFDEESADMLERLGVQRFKLASGDITHRALIEHVARKRKPLLLSTGMSSLSEVRQAVSWIRALARAELTVLHCLTEYPAPIGQVNLRAMDTMRNALNLPVGYSDHTPSIEISVAAAARGAVVIEKHLTLDRHLLGPDHAASLEPPEFQALVTAVRNVEAALGDGIKRMAPCERHNRLVARRSVVAARNLKAGHKLEHSDIAIKRPGNGISPAESDSVLGRTLRKDVRQDQVLTWEALR